MAHRDDYYDDDRDQMERDDEIDPISEIEGAVHEQTLFEDENGNFWPVVEDEDDEELPAEVLEELDENEEPEDY